MKKETLIKMIPYLVLTVGVMFTLWSMVQLQQAENSCNQHLKTEYEELMSEFEKVCPLVDRNALVPRYLGNFTGEVLVPIPLGDLN